MESKLPESIINLTTSQAALIEYLDEKFQHTHRKEFYRWSLHDFDYFGCTYGFDLLLIDGMFRLQQLVDSGYNKGDVLVLTNNADIIWMWAQCFSPTNPKYKTQRK